MITEVKPIAADQLTPNFFTRLKATGLYAHWHYDEWLQFMRWSKIDNPFRGNTPIAYGLYADETILAYISFTYLPFIIKNRSEIVAACGDLSALSGCGLKETLLFAHKAIKEKPTSLMVGFHFSQSTNAIWKRFGANAVQDSEKTFVKCISIKNKIINRIFKNNFLSHNSPAQKIEWHETAELEELFQQDYAAVDIATQRNINYLTWRYTDSPFAKNYYFVKTHDHNTLTGFAVLQKVAADARICEFTASAVHRQQLLSACVQLAQRLGCINLATKIIAPTYEKFWLQHHFKIVSKPYPQFLYVADADSAYRESRTALFSYGDFKLA